jgi:type II secretory pathway pseudopilin PulG
MKNTKQKKLLFPTHPLLIRNIGYSIAFTFIELVVVITIMALLWTIWFISFSDYIMKARDSSRYVDIWILKVSLKSSKQQSWAYPMPATYFNIINSWSSNLEIYEWLLNNDVSVNTLTSAPKDPKNKHYYFYSITKNKQEFQIAATLENNKKNIALLDWDYKTVSKNLFPTIIIAFSWEWQQVEIQSWVTSSGSDWSINRQKFIVNSWSYNLPYDFNTWNPVSSGTTVWFDSIINEAWVSFGTNNDYISCKEIYDAWKYLWPWEYQVLDGSWSITNTWCTDSNIY